MDYSLKGILVLLQDLQRIKFRSISMYVDVIAGDDSPILACCVFDGGGNPHTTCLYGFETDVQRKDKYSEILAIVKRIEDEQKH